MHAPAVSTYLPPASTAFQKQPGSSLRIDLLSLDRREVLLIRDAWLRRTLLASARDANPLVWGPKETWEVPLGEPCPRKIPDSWVSTVGAAG